MELVVKDRVPTFSKDQDIVIPVLDWLYGLLYRNGEYTWRSLNLNRFQYIRHHRMNDRDMTRNAIANTRELILGHISEADAEEVIALMKKGGEDDNALVPSPAFSLDTESVQMYPSDWNLSGNILPSRQFQHSSDCSQKNRVLGPALLI